MEFVAGRRRSVRGLTAQDFMVEAASIDLENQKIVENVTPMVRIVFLALYACEEAFHTGDAVGV